jgi:hypothetical protein
MAEKTNYFNITSVVLLALLFLLLLPHHNFYHRAEEDSRCGCPDTDLTENSVNEGSGVGIPLMKRSHGGWGSRRTIISGKRMNNLVLAAATVVLYGSTVAVFAYLYLKSLNFSRVQMSVIESNLVNPSAMDDFDEYDNIMSRRRIRAQGSLGRPWYCGQ